MAMAVQQMPSSTKEGFSNDVPQPQRQRDQRNHSDSKARDSSVDSGIHPASTASPVHSLSDTDSEIQEAFARKGSVGEGGVGPRLSSHETDNLVEELYFNQHSLRRRTGKTPSIEETKKDAGTFHASPYLNSEEELSGRTDRKLVENINNNNCVKNDLTKNYISLTNLKPEYLKDKTSQGEGRYGRHYVNQLDLESKIIQVAVSESVTPVPGLGPDVKVVVAVDLGTTYSGYAYCFTGHSHSHCDRDVHMMRKWEGGDPGLNNQKIPTTILITPEGQFHSFGFAARDFYHDLEPEEAKQWLYFDKFKKTLHNNPNVRQETKISAANGKSVSAVELFSVALRYLSKLVVSELSEQGCDVTPRSVRWLITVPAIWSHAAKQLMRQAAYKAGMCTSENPEALIIALEPEAAAVWCKNLRFDQLEGKLLSKEQYLQSNQGCCFMVVDCGGGTVDVTVHKLQHPQGPLKELYKASGEPCGSLGVDEEFDRLLGSVFGFPFMTRLRQERPAAYTELMLSFETRKRGVVPSRSSPLTLSLPFAFIDFYQTTTGKKVEEAVKEYGHPDQLSWSSQGMLRMSPQLMTELFQPTINNILKHVEGVLTSPEVAESIKHLFLVGGFAESALLQEAIRTKLSDLKIPPPIIPQGVALCVVRGAVLYGLNPGVVSVRKSRHTYGFGVLKPFQRASHPLDKLVVREGREWCADVFDCLVTVDQSLGTGESVVRRYTPANPSQACIVLHLYCTEHTSPQFVTDDGVERIGSLRLDLTSELGRNRPREILARLIFSSTELTVSAMDLETASYTDTSLTFLA